MCNDAISLRTVLCCLEGEVDLHSRSVWPSSVLSPDVFPQESCVPLRSIQGLSSSLCLCLTYGELLHPGPFSSGWVQIYHEDISDVVCSVRASLLLPG